jgi:endonuclease YncB( thermonuclease family)
VLRAGLFILELDPKRKLHGVLSRAKACRKHLENHAKASPKHPKHVQSHVVSVRDSDSLFKKYRPMTNMGFEKGQISYEIACSTESSSYIYTLEKKIP